MSGARGVDMDLRKLKPAKLKQLSSAITLYKRDIRDMVEQCENAVIKLFSEK